MIKEIYVKDIMVTISDYATVSENASLLGAVKAMERENKMYGDEPYRHRSVLVINDGGDVIGKVSQVDIMLALEPNYSQIGSDIYLGRFGFNLACIKAIRDQYVLWKRPIEDLYKLL